MKSHYEVINIIDSLIDEIYVNDKNIDKVVSKFFDNKVICDEVVYYLFNRYYMKNRPTLDQKGNSYKNLIINFIERNYQNKEKLYSLYYGNKELVKELVINYINNREINEKDVNSIYKIKKDHIAKSLDNEFNVIRLEFLGSTIRRELKTYFKEEGQIGDTVIKRADDLTDVPMLWVSIILSYSYIVAKLNEHHTYVYMLESYDLNTLTTMFRTNMEFYVTALGYYDCINTLSLEKYIYLFDVIEKDSDGIKTFRKLNKLYMFDKMDVENKRKSLKKF